MYLYAENFYNRLLLCGISNVWVALGELEKQAIVKGSTLQFSSQSVSELQTNTVKNGELVPGAMYFARGPDRWPKTSVAKT